ncbi:hypothetical protein HZA55_10900 [Candidatus Poribacteria bacterium]|nr:hypothetical protein [Candidatus Poribacteria bacterium]
MFLEKIFPLWFILIVFFIAVIIVAVSYFNASLKISFTMRLILLSLKIAAIAILIFAFFQPYILTHKERKEKSTLAILIDTSPTMGFKDNNQISRLDMVNGIFKNKENNIIDKLKKDHKVKVYTFSDQISSAIVREPMAFSLNGYRTGIVNAIEQAMQYDRADNLSNIVVFSDGQDSFLANFLSSTKDFEYPIFTVGIGQANKIKDVHLVKIKKDEIAYIDKETEISVVLTNSGYKGEEVTFVLFEDANEIVKQKYLLQKDGDEENVNIKFKSSVPGWHKYSLVITPLPLEKVVENNSTVFYIQVIQEKIKILFIEGSPRLDFKFIKKAIEEDKNLEINFLVYKNKNEFFKIKDEFLTAFPDQNTFYKYNLIILSNIGIQYFKNNEIEMLKDFVERIGGSILFLTGENSTGYSGSELEKILPVGFPPQFIFHDDNFRPVLTREGIIHPIMKLDPSADVNKEIWNGLPELTGVMAISKIKPGAIVLAWHPELKYNLGFIVVMAIQEYGKGKTMIINAEGLWRWDFLMWGAGDKNAYAGKFWKNLSRYLGGTEKKKGFSLQTDKKLYTIGDNINLRISLYDNLFKPLSGARIECTIKNMNTGSEMPIEISNFENIPGIYGGNMKVNEVQEASINAKAIYDKKVVGIENLNISVIAPLEEYSHLEMNEKGLKELASVSKGDYFILQNLNELPEKLKKNISGGSLVVKIELWDTVWYFIILVGLLALEWWLRKNKGLD